MDWKAAAVLVLIVMVGVILAGYAEGFFSGLFKSAGA